MYVKRTLYALIHGIFRFSEETRRSKCARSDGRTLREILYYGDVLSYMREQRSGRKEFIKKYEQVCDNNAEKMAITYLLDSGDKKLFTYKDLHELSKSLSEKLCKVGLTQGDRVAIISVLSPYCYIAYFAFVYAGLTAVIIDPQLPEQEKDRLLANADIRGIVSSEAVYDNYANHFDKEMPVLNIENGQGFVEKCSATLLPTSDPDIDAAAILYSSGTTSQAKGVVIGFEQQIRATVVDLEFVGTNDIRWLEVYPFFHISGLSSSLAILFNGAEIGLIENVSAVKLQQAFQSYRPNTFALVPKVYEVFEGKVREAIKEKGAFAESVLLTLMRLCGFIRKHSGLNIGKYLFASVNRQLFGGQMKFLGVGGGLSKPKTIEFFLQLGFVWFNTYASTEANVPITATTYKDRYPLFSSGRVDRFPNVSIKINSPNASGEGEILVQSDLLLKGYFRDPELTSAAFDEYGYFKTGDLGFVNKKNELIITGRAKEFIGLHSGEKVSPEDIERLYTEVITSAPFACAAVPCKAGDFDEAHLFIVIGELSKDEQQDLRKRIMMFSSQTGTLYQISVIHFIDELPTTSVGKVKRFQLKEIALAELSGGSTL